MKHTITRHQNRIEIELTGFDTSGFRTFGCEAYHGDVRHECGPDKYTTLESLQTSAIPGGMKLEVHGRSSSSLDIREAEQCIDHAVDYILADHCEEERNL